MSLYAGGRSSPNGMHSQSPNGGMQDVPKANHSCSSCRKQKRKCSKTLPACALCERMNRHCDYSDAVPAPSAEDFNVLRMRVMELESRVPSHPNGMVSPPTTFSTATPTASDPVGPHQTLPPYNHTPPQDIPWQTLQNRFPAFAFLDSEQFKTGGYVMLLPIGTSSPSQDTKANLSFQSRRTKANLLGDSSGKF